MRAHQEDAAAGGRLLLPALALSFVLATGCAATGTAGTCRDDSDCAGQACVAGSCRPLAASDAGSDDDALSTQPDLASTTIPDGGTADAIAPLCNFNNDGVITREESPVVVGLGGLFAENAAGQTVAVSLHAQNGTWDYSAAVAGDHKIFDEILAPGGSWWSADFPGATYAEKLDENQPYLGIFKSTATAIQLVGLVSETSGLTQTSLKYTTPIDVVRFPLKVGSTWTSESVVSGTASGVLFTGYEKYAFTVDQRGNVKVPAGSFDTLRLRVDYSETVGLLVTTRFTYLHMAECYGSVARIRSKDDETNADFTEAEEYRRLSDPLMQAHHPVRETGAAALRRRLARAGLCACISALCGCVHFQAEPSEMPIPVRSVTGTATGTATGAATEKPDPGAARPEELVELPGRGLVRVIERNPRGRETILLIHGYGSSSSSYRPVLAELSTGFRVLAVDLPGFGASDRLEGDYSPDALADALARLLDQKGVRRAHVIGHSWGGSIALAFALRHPDRLGHLAVISGWVFDDQLLPLMRWARAPGLGELLFALFYHQALSERLYLNFNDPALVTEEVVDGVKKQAGREGSTAVALAVARGMAQLADNEKRYRTIGAPTLLLWGREDKVSRVAFGERLARQIPHAQLVVLPSCGHLPMWECTPGTLAALREFLPNDGGEGGGAAPIGRGE